MANAKNAKGYKPPANAVKGPKPSSKRVADSTTRGFAGPWAQSNTQKGKGR